MDVFQFAYNNDNYGVLLHDVKTGATACVDAGDADATLAALAQKGWSLTEIWITHHHWDHTDGLEALKAATGAMVRGPQYVSAKPIAGLDETYSDGDSFSFAGEAVQIIHTPGHTLDMINFYLPESLLLFSGDTLFVMGCGRIFEGTPAQMHESLQKLAALPDDVLVYCAHEYTLASADFALSIDAANEALINRVEIVQTLRNQGEATVPTMMAIEKATNPFLRAHDPAIRAHLGLENATDEDVFTAIRKAKDNY